MSPSIYSCLTWAAKKLYGLHSGLEGFEGMDIVVRYDAPEDTMYLMASKPKEWK